MIIHHGKGQLIAPKRMVKIQRDDPNLTAFLERFAQWTFEYEPQVNSPSNLSPSDDSSQASWEEHTIAGWFCMLALAS